MESSEILEQNTARISANLRKFLWFFSWSCSKNQKTKEYFFLLKFFKKSSLIRYVVIKWLHKGSSDLLLNIDSAFHFKLKMFLG